MLNKIKLKSSHPIELYDIDEYLNLENLFDDQLATTKEVYDSVVNVDNENVSVEVDSIEENKINIPSSKEARDGLEKFILYLESSSLQWKWFK